MLNREIRAKDEEIGRLSVKLAGVEQVMQKMGEMEERLARASSSRAQPRGSLPHHTV